MKKLKRKNEQYGAAHSGIWKLKYYLKSTVQFWHFICTFNPDPLPILAVNLEGLLFEPRISGYPCTVAGASVPENVPPVIVPVAPTALLGCAGIFTAVMPLVELILESVPEVLVIDCTRLA
jgi:hypothetical protein